MSDLSKSSRLLLHKITQIYKNNFFIKNINTIHFSNLYINTRNCICAFEWRKVLNNVRLIVIKDIQNKKTKNYTIY